MSQEKIQQAAETLDDLRSKFDALSKRVDATKDLAEFAAIKKEAADLIVDAFEAHGEHIDVDALFKLNGMLMKKIKVVKDSLKESSQPGQVNTRIPATTKESHMDPKEHLKAALQGLINDDEGAARAAISQALLIKSQRVLHPEVETPEEVEQAEAE